VTPSKAPAQHEDSVKSLYQNEKVAENYIQNRFAWAWSRLLHETQVRVLNDAIEKNRIETALELAPGPARIAPDLKGIRAGIMVEASEPMIDVARRRIDAKGLGGVWDIRHGNAFDLAPLGRTFDFAFTFRFIRHFQADDRKRLYAQIAGRLNPSGLLVFDVVNRPVREKLDAKEKPAQGENLPVYDATYTAEEFRDEMRANGFEVTALHESIRHFDAQSWLSYHVGPRLPGVAWGLVKALEALPARNPLEWVAVCRKMG
jgi:SAM-dependent methyltransferase